MILLWLRWSWRDLRARWLQVAAIAVIIALGAGTYTGLSSQNQWRRTAYDASFDALAVHDLRVRAADGTFVDQGQFLAAIETLGERSRVVSAEERLVVRTQVDTVDADGETVLVPARIVGVDLDGAGGTVGPRIDKIHVASGRSLLREDDESRAVLLDSHFADHHGLEATGSLILGDGAVEYVGTGYSPEYFLISGESGSLLAEAGFAVLFAGIESTQAMAGTPGQVNELVVRYEEGLDEPAREQALSDVRAALALGLPNAALEFEPIENNREYRRLYDDIDGDQKLFNIFAGLILAGAAFAAFNLVGRIVEAQRREIGIGMAIGMSRSAIAIRPLLVGIQVSLLGAVFGTGVGLFVGSMMSDLNQKFVPLPIWNDPFLPDVFLRGSALGVTLTFAATVWPVWRAVRVEPVDAIRTGPSRKLEPRGHRVFAPGSSIAQFPVRNVLRSPRRTALTAFGIAAVISVLLALIGMIDSVFATIGEGEQEILGDEPERVIVSLDFFDLATSPKVTALSDVDGVAVAEPGLRLGGTISSPGSASADGETGEPGTSSSSPGASGSATGPDTGSGEETSGQGLDLSDLADDEVPVLIQLIDLSSPVWVPTTVRGSYADSNDGGLVISRKAAEDLGVGPGDMVVYKHPLREGLGYRFVESDVRVAAVHANPYRFVVYQDIEAAGLYNLEGVVNTVSVLPEDGVDSNDLKRSLFEMPGVATVEGVGDVAANIREVMEEFLGFLGVVEGAVLLLAVLIAFNSTAISADERRREHATMFAFGLPVRTVMALTVVESALVGLAGTAIGVASGRLLLQWLLSVLIPETVPDLGIIIEVSTSTYATAGLLGVVAVALAPLLTLRRMAAMDIPATLRVVE